jgi:ABC-type sugar transport system permease subunit
MTTGLAIAILVWAAAMYGIRHVRSSRVRENLEAYLYLAPAGAVLLVFWFVPVVFSIIVSFTDWTGASKMATVAWIGITNYRRALSDPDFTR